MNIQSMLLLLCVIKLLSGCSLSSTADNDISLFANGDMPTSLDKAQMQLYIVSAESQLLLLEQQEPKQCLSGQLAIANTYLLRATAEHNAGMEKDAFITLVDFDRQVRKIRCLSQYINDQLGCGYTNKKIVLKRWYREGDFSQCKKSSITKNNRGKKPIFITETLHEFDQNEIKPIYYQSLNKLVDLMKNYPNSTLRIRGNTDSKGSNDYNMQLSQRRADSVAKYFTDRGIKASQLSIQGQGEINIRELEQNDVSRVFNRYTSITLFLGDLDKKAI
ncbi:MAG: OmpA family protein [Colwellia sp.]